MTMYERRAESLVRRLALLHGRRAALDWAQDHFEKILMHDVDGAAVWDRVIERVREETRTWQPS